MSQVSRSLQAQLWQLGSKVRHVRNSWHAAGTSVSSHHSGHWPPQRLVLLPGRWLAAAGSCRLVLLPGRCWLQRLQACQGHLGHLAPGEQAPSWLAAGPAAACRKCMDAETLWMSKEQVANRNTPGGQRSQACTHLSACWWHVRLRCSQRALASTMLWCCNCCKLVLRQVRLRTWGTWSTGAVVAGCSTCGRIQ